jgi:hypothetical protein
VGLTMDESNVLMVKDPEKFKLAVQESLRRQVVAINKMAENGMYFWDYGNAFLLEACRAGANVMNPDGSFIYASYVQDIMGPLFFDYGFGPFRWVCTSGDPEDLAITDLIAETILEEIAMTSPKEIEMPGETSLWLGLRHVSFMPIVKGELKSQQHSTTQSPQDGFQPRLFLGATIMTYPVPIHLIVKLQISMTVQVLRPIWPYRM